MSPRAERRFAIAGRVVIVLFASAWGWSITRFGGDAGAATVGPDGARAPNAVSAVTSALTNRSAVSTAYLTDAALTAVANRIVQTQRGVSGKLRATFQAGPVALGVDSLPPGASLRLARGDSSQTTSSPVGAGIWKLVVAAGSIIKPITDFNVVSMLPFSAKKNGRVGTYFIGSWPSERGAKGPAKAPADRYANPSGFIEVTQENRNTPVSDHFRLGDFLTHDQPNVWPKYLVLQLRLIDKLELVMSDLQAHGIETRGVRVMSGFRTPQYNENGGNPSGRADLSRHMYGDAADIYIDNDGNGAMDDLNHDGRVDIGDSRVILAAEERVEAAHPELIGGGGLYRAAAGHGPFIHIDTRGYRARW